MMQARNGFNNSQGFNDNMNTQYTQNQTPSRNFRRSMYSENLDSKQKVYEERLSRLMEEFDQYDTNHSHMIEREEVRMILDQRIRHTGKEYNEELIDAIFSNLDRDINGRISKQEFCQGYIDVENFFTETIDT